MVLLAFVGGGLVHLLGLTLGLLGGAILALRGAILTLGGTGASPEHKGDLLPNQSSCCLSKSTLMMSWRPYHCNSDEPHRSEPQ